MSKQKKNKQSQLSPENYIRQRARNLPIFKCFINKDWEKSKSATVFVVRQHASGNLTFCVYMVDLLCLGVKDTLYKYNVPEEELQRILNASQGKIKFMEISYELAHNIVYAAIEYADEYGFNPSPDFTRVTQYLLEEDTEDIPLIRVHCGDENGKPIYINTGLDSPAKEKQILARLNKIAGPENYKYVLAPNFDDDDDDYDNDYEEEDEEYKQLKARLRSLNKKQLKQRFSDLRKEIAEIPDKDFTNKHELFEYMRAVVDVIMEDIIDEDKVVKYFNVFKNIFDFDIINIINTPNSFFAGLQYDDSEKLRNVCDKVVERLDSGEIEQSLEDFRKEVGDIAAVKYLELAYSNFSKDEYNAKLDEYSQKYPDYLLFKIFQYSRGPELYEKFKTFLTEVNEPITEIECAEFLNRYAIYLVQNCSDLEELIAFEVVLKYYKKDHIPVDNALVLMMLTKIGVVHDIIEEENTK